MTPDPLIADFGDRLEVDARRMRELHVLACLLRGGRIADARQFCSPDDFLGKDTRALAEAFWEAGDGVDRQHVFTDLALASAPALIADVPLSYGQAGSTASYARALARERLRERLLQRFGNAMQDLRRGDPEQIASELGLNETLAAPSVSVSDALREAIADGESAAKRAAEGKAAGLSTGLQALDRRTGGILRGDLWTLVADTSMGKSALALQIARKVALQGGRVGYISLEMPARDIGRRILAASAGINSTDLRKGDAGTLAQARQHAPALEKLPLLIDTQSDTPDAIESRLYRWNAEAVDLVILDHLMCVDFDRRDVFADQGRLMKRMRRLTMQLDLSVLCVTQYRKDSGSSRTMADIYGSAAVSQYSTHVLAIHPDKADANDRRLELFKNRDGVKGALPVRCEFDGRTQTLKERLAPIDPEDHYPPMEDLPI